MFRIDPNPTFARDVVIQVPTDEGYEAHTLRTRFKVVDFDTLTSFDLMKPADQTAYLDAIVERFENVGDHEGKVLEPTPDLKARILAMPFTRAPLMKAYERALTEEAQKN